MSVGVRVSLFVCLFVRSITQKRMIQIVPTWYRESSWDILEVLLFWGSKVKGQGHSINKCIFHTNVRSITQKRMIPNCSDLIQGVTLGYPASGIVLGWKVKGLG